MEEISFYCTPEQAHDQEYLKSVIAKQRKKK